MSNFRITFSHPWLLLLLIPALAFAFLPYFLLNKKYRRNRNRVTSLVLHVLIMVLSIAVLSGMTFRYDIVNKDNEVLLLVDASYSGKDGQEEKDEFVRTVAEICGEDYKLGIVKFGYDQKYVAPLSNDSEAVFRAFLESEDPDTSATDIAGALRYAATLFSVPQTSKIVLLSDGIETDNAAATVIKAIAAQGIKVDTVNFPNAQSDEIQIVGVTLPDHSIVAGEDFTMGITLKTDITAEDVLSAPLVSIKVYDNGEEAASSLLPVPLSQPEQTFELTHSFALPGMHELRFEIESYDDTMEQNNSYRTYINLEVFEDILVLESSAGESEGLCNILDDKKCTVLNITEDLEEIPRTVSELSEYDQVILVNVAYKDMPSGFEEILYEYVYRLGGGLFTVGGKLDDANGKKSPHAYNREDMANSQYFRQMLPVQAIDYTPPIAVMLVLDASGSMSMGKFEAAQSAAKTALASLDTRDYCGIMSFNTTAGEEINVLPVSQRDKIEQAIDNVGKDDDGGTGGTIFAGTIDRAGRALMEIDHVERRHIILITDGNPSDSMGDFEKYIKVNTDAGITMSVAVVQGQADHVNNMRQVAELGGGVCYDVKDFKEFGLLMQQDLAMNAVAEIEYGKEFTPEANGLSPIFAGVEEIPVLSGYYGTRLKEGAVAPIMGEYVPIYAQWKFGEGNVGSFMSDIGGDWSQKFTASPNGQTLVRNIVNNLFPLHAIQSDDIEVALKTDNYTSQLNVYTELAETERVEVEVTPLSRDALAAVGSSVPTTAVGGYSRFTFVVTQPGLYRINVVKKDAEGNRISQYTLYHTFSYSQEYNAFPEREPLGEELMNILAQDGRGKAVTDPMEVFETFVKTLPRSADPRLPFLITALVLFLLDVAVRKFKFKWPHELIRERREKKAKQK